MALKKCRECGTEISSKAKVCPSCGAPQKKKSRLLGFAVLIIVATGVITAMSVNNPSSPSRSSTAVSRPKPVNKNAVALAKAKLHYSWSKSGFGNVMMISKLTITNGSKYPFKDPLVRCTMYAPSGTALGDVEKTFYRIIKPHGRLTATHVNMGLMNDQANSASCRIVYVVAQ